MNDHATYRLAGEFKRTVTTSPRDLWISVKLAYVHELSLSLWVIMFPFYSSSFAGFLFVRCGLLAKPGLAGVDDGKPESTDRVGFSCLVRSDTDVVLMSRDFRDVT